MRRGTLRSVLKATPSPVQLALKAAACAMRTMKWRLEILERGDPAVLAMARMPPEFLCRSAYQVKWHMLGIDAFERIN